jgi:ABC-type Fe3+/spermidine/putrescine transport system ATPase subunit/ABC-type sulfate transport system permease component
MRGVIRGPLPWLAALIVVYLAVPVIAFAIRFVEAKNRGFGEPGLFPSFFVSLESATISLLIITLLGVPLSYLLARSRGPIASFIGVVVQLPLALPPLMSGILLIYVVGPYTYLGQLFDGRLTMSLMGIVLAQTFVAAPFLIVAARAAFSTVDPALLDVAATLGHSETARFRRVALPLAGPGIRAGMLLAWLRAFGEYGAIAVLAYHPFSLPIYTYNQFSGAGLPTTIAPTGLALAVAVVSVIGSRLHIRHRRRTPIEIPDPSSPPSFHPMPLQFDIDFHVGSFHLGLGHQSSTSRLAILGPSGSGKTLLLRCVAGLCGSDPGPVTVGSRSVQDLKVEDRKFGYVAQGFSLFPHLTVWEHLLFPRGATPSTAAYWLAHLRLEGLEDRYPSQLSGGQRQRVGLAQVLCRSPDLLLLDEPLSALDVPIRRELRRELQRLQRETGMTTVIVTHDPEEAAVLADEIIVISEGAKLQSDSTRRVFSRPSSPDVARLLGIPNLFTGIVSSEGRIETENVSLPLDTGGFARGTAVQWSIRPEHIRLSDGGNLTGVLSEIADTGTHTQLTIALGSHFEVEVWTPDHLELEIGHLCGVEFPPGAVTIWPDSSGLVQGRA